MVDSVAPDVRRAEETCAQPIPTPAQLRARRRDVRAHLNRMGLTIRSWAEANGYRPKQVYKVLNGELQGNYGAAHEIAVKLGIKEGAPEASHV